MLEQARPMHDEVLREVLAEAVDIPELTLLVRALTEVDAMVGVGVS